MLKKINKNANRIKRHKRLRNHISGTSAKPRLSVYRSSKHIYAQLIDDEAGNTLLSASTLDKALNLENTGNIEAAKAVGASIAEKAKEKGIEEVVFDRSGYVYHGKIKALADAAREAGLKF
ncbi:50S ribosomal protein L18 [Peptoniphilus sp. AGMB00490]|uniref:50S ribosomal protein L18 n=2 Tax=Peptoniphilus TaxID=162289 RepID=A0ACD6AZV5_9FIRM|nr:MULTISPECIES: 50S ribosomal protein L18 [Peptoniphilus]NMW84996.1 50S ribosomal protein L18 [Peptoniphilus faecalis]OLR65445.1 50S ribosomal protein L18 [Peptoniphilus porci]